MPKQSPISITARITGLAKQRRWLLPVTLLLALMLACVSYLLLQTAVQQPGLVVVGFITSALFLYLLILLLINIDTTLDLRATAKKLTRSDRGAVVEQPLYTEQITTILLPQPTTDQTEPASEDSLK